jgi:hypothetical protein
VRDGRDGEHESRQPPTRPLNVLAPETETKLDGAGVRWSGSKYLENTFKVMLFRISSRRRHSERPHQALT